MLEKRIDDKEKIVLNILGTIYQEAKKAKKTRSDLSIQNLVFVLQGLEFIEPLFSFDDLDYSQDLDSSIINLKRKGFVTGLDSGLLANSLGRSYAQSYQEPINHVIMLGEDKLFYLRNLISLSKIKKKEPEEIDFIDLYHFCRIRDKDYFETMAVYLSLKDLKKQNKNK
jgi:hypothetical protein